MVFQDVAENCYQYSQPGGYEALGSWIGASNDFNQYMLINDIQNAFAKLNQANDAFANVYEFLRDLNPPLADLFEQISQEFTVQLNSGNVTAINEYMIWAYPQFKEKLGC